MQASRNSARFSQFWTMMRTLQLENWKYTGSEPEIRLTSRYLNIFRLFHKHRKWLQTFTIGWWITSMLLRIKWKDTITKYLIFSYLNCLLTTACPMIQYLYCLVDVVPPAKMKKMGVVRNHAENRKRNHEKYDYQTGPYQNSITVFWSRLRR